MLRALTIFCCCADIGALIALYERVGKSFMPKVWMRLLMVSSAIWILAAVVVSYERIGMGLNWRTPVFALAASLQLVAFIGLYHWYGGAEGKAHIERMTREQQK